MDVQKLFEDLESNNPQESEAAKKTLAEFINQTKDQSILQGVMDYYVRTNSVRIIDVLVKVQSPIDMCVLDRIADWMRGQHRPVALDLLGFIIRKPPTWLYKIAKHKLIKEILKLLQTEKEIIHLMSALLCIITLLPIIPSSVPSFLPDLLDGFGHLAAWNAQNANTMHESQIIHIQIGIYLLFHYLYGMYPNSFLRYLRRFASKDSAIYQSTIRPLLETVKMHPLLVCSTPEDETNNTRWKEKQPHDIVVECAKLSLEYHQDSVVYFCKNVMLRKEAAANEAQISQLQFSSWNRPIPAFSTITDMSGTFRSLVDGSNLLAVQKMKNPIWSPSAEILSTPPPTAAITHTPTPNYNVPNMPSNVSGATGASPPEAAVEATPETTPLKDAVKRTIAANSTAIRALPVSSEPGTPLHKIDSKDVQPFDFNQQTYQLKGLHFRLLQVGRDRSESEKRLSSSKSVDLSGPSTTTGALQYDAQAVRSINLQPLDSPTNITESTQEDQEVSELTNTNFAVTHSDTLQDISADCGDETEQSPCSIGGLNSAACSTMPLQERRALRNRPKICCLNDHSSYLSYGTSPADNEHTDRCKLIKSTCRVRRSRSWPVIKNLQEVVTRQTQYSYQTNGESSSPSGDDAVSAATHFKQIQQKSKLARKFDGRLLTCRKDSCTQTLPQWNYEEKLFELVIEQNKLRQMNQKKPFDPYEMFDQCVSKNVADTKNREDVLRDQIRLLHLLLNFERYRREVHAERNRRLLGKSRDLRSLEKDEDRLRDQLKKQQDEMEKLTMYAEKHRRRAKHREEELMSEVNLWKSKYHTELETSKQLRLNIENLQRRVNEEMAGRKGMMLQIEALQGELFDMRNEMQQVQYQAELGLQYKKELVKLQTELMVVGEIQVKCRDKLNDLESLKARDEEASQLQESYSKEIRETRSALETKSAQFDAATHQISALQANNAAKDINFTDQKRLLKSAKEEYDEKFKALEKKYEIQKMVIVQMEDRIAELYRNQTATSMATTTPESERTDFISSMEHNSPLSVSLTSNEGLSTSLRSVTELRNLQALVVSPPNTATEHNSRSIPVTSSSVNISHQQATTSSQPFASASSSTTISSTRRTSSSIQTSSHSSITMGTTTTTTFNEMTTRLQNISSTSSSSSSAL